MHKSSKFTAVAAFQRLVAPPRTFRAALIVAAFVFPTCLEASDWHKLVTGSDGLVYEVDTSNITYEKHQVTYWERISVPDGTKRYVQVRLDCASRTWTILTAQFRNKRGAVTYSFTPQMPETRAIPPDSVVDAKREAICGLLNAVEESTK